MKKTYLYLTFVILLGAVQAEVVLDLDPRQVEENLTKKPQFSTTSTDQKAIDETLEKNQEQTDQQVFSQIAKIEECKKKASFEEIKKCRYDSLKKNQKSKSSSKDNQ